MMNKSPYIKAIFDLFHYNLKTITNTRNAINICNRYSFT